VYSVRIPAIVITRIGPWCRFALLTAPKAAVLLVIVIKHSRQDAVARPSKHCVTSD
jgi:hypothetical protein